MDGKYCFVYSSEHNHDLCYAMADSPKGPFTYGGVLVDIGDLYLNGNEDETHASNYLGNTHGEMLQIEESGYIFIIDRQIVVLMQDRHVQKNMDR